MLVLHIIYFVHIDKEHEWVETDNNVLLCSQETLQLCKPLAFLSGTYINDVMQPGWDIRGK